ncbi:MAG: hypothetical protein LC117_08490 [Bacteroidia bacterium]|nr:hypothetical protein [Bacteroidia bacterium]MCZ2277949.1 hypothetical protein [Bacteroidia bacterium]
MKELINEISTKAGISLEQAEKAAQTVTDYLKRHTPHLFHEQLDTLLAGGTLSDSFKNKLGSLKDDLEDAARNIGKKAEEFAGDLKKKFSS